MEENLNDKEKLIITYIGKNHKEMYNKIIHGGFYFGTFLLPGIFFAGRKMFLIGLIFLIIDCIFIDFIKIIPLTIIYRIICGFLFYPIYHKWILSKIKKLENKNLSFEDQLNYAQKYNNDNFSIFHMFILIIYIFIFIYAKEFYGIIFHNQSFSQIADLNNSLINDVSSSTDNSNELIDNYNQYYNDINDKYNKLYNEINDKYNMIMSNIIQDSNNVSDNLTVSHGTNNISLKELQFSIPTDFISHSINESYQMYSDENETSYIVLEAIKNYYYTSAEDYLNSYIILDYDDTKSNTEIESINGINWTKITVQSSFKKDYYYATLYNNSIYFINFYTYDLTSSIPKQYLDKIKSSFNF